MLDIRNIRSVRIIAHNIDQLFDVFNVAWPGPLCSVSYSRCEGHF